MEKYLNKESVSNSYSNKSQMEENEKEEQEYKDPKCRKCNSAMGYLRIKDKSWVCRRCGFVDTEVNL
ncbi:unnamed protein product [marine sediment metagenome]|uniref:Uncharacterized protein n=1 Tax=marine sediment metagenome TaxID=412755 RepID=X1GR79_9ZZZZ